MPTEIDYARAAAYIDGEGCIRVEAVMRKGVKGRPSGNKQYRCFVLKVVIASIDSRLPNWLRRNFGGNIGMQHHDKATTTKGRPDGYARRPLWYWRIASGGAEAIIRGALPFFIIKREQAEVALSFRETYRKCHHGRNKSVPENVLELRYSAVQKLRDLKTNIPIEEAS